MVIRKAGIQPTQQVQPKKLEEEQKQTLSPSELSSVLQKIFGNSQVHGNELPSLEKALKNAGPLKNDFLKDIEKRLSDPNLNVTSDTLGKLKALGVDVTKASENLKKNTDLKTSEKLGQTADKTVADKVVGEQAAKNALGSQQAVLDSHKGTAVARNELSPEYKLAKQLVGDVAGKIWSDKAPPELKAIKEAIGPQVGALAQQTAMSVMSDPNAMANITGLLAKVGKEGFPAALQASSKEVFGHFLNTAGVQAKNPAAIKAALSGIETMAPKLGSTLGPKIAETASKLGPKLLGEGAEVAAKAGAAAAVKGGATTAAKAGGQALPIIGNVISVGSTLLAGANLVSQMTKKPRDFEKIMKEGLNTITQAVGVAFPWVGLGGTLVDAAWGAKTSVSDQKKQAQGIPVTENANAIEAFKMFGDIGAVARPFLEGAGMHGSVDKLDKLLTTTKTMQDLDLNNPKDRISLYRKDQQEALMALSSDMATKFDEVSADAGPHMQEMKRNADLWRELGGVLAKAKLFDKREGMPGLDDKAKADLGTKRKELASELMNIIPKIGLGHLKVHTEQNASAA